MPASSRVISSEALNASLMNRFDVISESSQLRAERSVVADDEVDDVGDAMESVGRLLREADGYNGEDIDGDKGDESMVHADIPRATRCW